MIQSRQIEAFRAVMHTGAMTAAAEIIHVTQPAVSRLIRDLEAELGFALFDRRGNLVSPTSHARALLTEVERSFIGLGQIRAFAENLRTGQGGSVRVAALPAVAAGFLPRFAAKFSQHRPNLKISIDGLPSPAIRDKAVTGQLDIGITAFPFHNASLVITPLGDRAVVAMPNGHRLAGLKVIRATDLRDEQLILLTRFTARGHPVDVALQSTSKRSPIETPLATMACFLVAEGLGIAIVDPFSASEFLDKGLSLRPFEHSWVLGSAIVHSSERVLSVAASEFKTMFLDQAARFLAEFNSSGTHIVEGRSAFGDRSTQTGALNV
jgi:DNA-binding transcriptional LysR family regulator